MCAGTLKINPLGFICNAKRDSIFTILKRLTRSADYLKKKKKGNWGKYLQNFQVSGGD